MAMTAAVPIASARGTLRPGSRISSATYVAAFQPEYVNITGISASNHEPGTTRAGSDRCERDPEPHAKPTAMNNAKAVTFNDASMLPTIRPGATPVQPCHGRDDRDGRQ